jgi:hypothetical protein
MSSNNMFSMSTSYSYNCNDKCAFANGSIYNGDNTNACIQCPPGPTGPAGDKYLSYFSTTFYANRLTNGSKLGIQIDQYLSYVPNDRIFVQVVATDAYPIAYRFYATVVTYDPLTGKMIMNKISDITPSFPFGQLRTFVVNMYNDTAGPTGFRGQTGPAGPIGPTGNSISIGPTGIGSMVVTDPNNTASINYTNLVTVNSSSVVIQGYTLQMLTGIQEHVGYINTSPYEIDYYCNVYYITILGDCTIVLPQITSISDGFYLYFRRVYYDTGIVTFLSSTSEEGGGPLNIVSEGQYIGDAINSYQIQLVGTDSVRTFRVGTIEGDSYWFVNTA